MTTMHDFKDDNGSVPAHQHTNPDGSIGGWVAETAHVDSTTTIGRGSQVYGEARVYGGAWVSGEARISGKAQVYGKAWVSGEALVCDQARIFGKAWVSGKAQVSDQARVYGEARVCDQARVSGEARVYDQAWVFGKARVCDQARVYGEARVSGDTWTWGETPTPSIEDQRGLAKEILNQIEGGGELEMNTWHTCNTTHCLAGWAQMIRDGKQNDDQAYESGIRHLPTLAPYFFASNDEALAALKKFAVEP